MELCYDQLFLTPIAARMDVNVACIVLPSILHYFHLPWLQNWLVSKAILSFKLINPRILFIMHTVIVKWIIILLCHFLISALSIYKVIQVLLCEIVDKSEDRPVVLIATGENYLQDDFRLPALVPR